MSMAKRNGIDYIITSRIPKWSFLNGYTCNSESKDHFLRHLGYRFYMSTNMYLLNNAYEFGEIKIDIFKKNVIKVKVNNKKLNVVNEYWGDYGYIVEIDHGTVDNELIETMQFVNDIDAKEWIELYE